MCFTWHVDRSGFPNRGRCVRHKSQSRTEDCEQEEHGNLPHVRKVGNATYRKMPSPAERNIALDIERFLDVVTTSEKRSISRLIFLQAPEVIFCKPTRPPTVHCGYPHAPLIAVFLVLGRLTHRLLFGDKGSTRRVKHMHRLY